MFELSMFEVRSSFRLPSLSASHAIFFCKFFKSAILETFNLTPKHSIPYFLIITMFSSKSLKTLQNSTPSSAVSAFLADFIASDDDLLILILLRLPIKSLLKFKSVSKHWLSIISDPIFSHRRSSHGRPTPSGLFFTRINLEYDFVNLTPYPCRPPLISLFFGPQPTAIFQSCNGLLLCGFNDFPQYYFVYNPTTKQYSRLPDLQVNAPNSPYMYGVSLAFEPSKSSHYKVVCARLCNYSSENYQIDIYSSEGGPWRKSGAILSRHVYLGGGVYCNGAIHWITTTSSIYFKVDEETFHELSMPEIPGGQSNRNIGYVSESGGRLLLMEIYEPDITQFNVYEMEEDRSGWFVKHRVDLETLKLNFPEIERNDDFPPSDPEFYGFSLLCITGDEVEDGSYMVLNIPGKLIRYDLKSKTGEVIFDTDEEADAHGFLYRWSDVHQYIESLSCV